MAEEETTEAPPPVPLQLSVTDIHPQSATLSFKLPFGASGSQVRVMLRPTRLVGQYKKEAEAISQEMTQAQIKFQMKNAASKPGQAGGNNWADFQRDVIQPLRNKQSEVDKAMKNKVFKAFNVPADGAEYLDVPSEGWMIFVPPSKGAKEGDASTFRYYPLAYASTKYFTMTAKESGNLLEIVGLPSNTQLEIRASARVDPEKDWGNFSNTVTFWTPADLWQITLEKKGLHSLVPIFLDNKLTSPSDWADMSEERANQLGIDPATVAQLQEVVVSLGILTKAEMERIEIENKELARTATALVAEVTSGKQALSLGDPVVNKQGRFGIVIKSEDEGTTLPSDKMMVRWGIDLDSPTEVVNVDTLSLSEWGMILSHAQQEAANQVAHLSLLLKEHAINAWLDMDAERLEARDMVRGVRNSKVFLLYLTKSYLTRYFCRLEATTARMLNKKIIIVYESDPRFGGLPDYVQLVDEATSKRGYGDWRSFLLGIEAIPMARRGFQRRAVVEEIIKRAGITISTSSTPPTIPEAGHEAPAASEPKHSSFFSGFRRASQAVTGGSGKDGETIKQLKRTIVDLQMALTDLRGENEQLWKAIAELKEDLKSKS